MKDFELSSSG